MKLQLTKIHKLPFFLFRPTLLHDHAASRLVKKLSSVWLKKSLESLFQGRGSSGGPGDQFPGWADGRWFRRVGRNGDLTFGWRTPLGDQTSGQRGKKTNIFSSAENINFPHRRSRHLVGEKGNVTLFSSITVSWPSEKLCLNNTKIMVCFFRGVQAA